MVKPCIAWASCIQAGIQVSVHIVAEMIVCHKLAISPYTVSKWYLGKSILGACLMYHLTHWWKYQIIYSLNRNKFWCNFFFIGFIILTLIFSYSAQPILRRKGSRDLNVPVSIYLLHDTESFDMILINVSINKGVALEYTFTDTFASVY